MNMWIDPLFTADDLEANRQGILSEAQKKKLRARQPVILMLALLVASLPLIIVVVGILIFTNQSETRDPFYEASLVLVLVCTFIAGGVLPAPLAFMWPFLRRSFRALTEKTVLFVDGYVDFQPMRWRRYRLIVQDNGGSKMEFIVKQDVINAFEKGRHYRVYYTQKLKRVISAEMIGAE